MTTRTVVVPSGTQEEIYLVFPDARLTVEQMDAVIEYLTFLKGFIERADLILAGRDVPRPAPKRLLPGERE